MKLPGCPRSKSRRRELQHHRGRECRWSNQHGGLGQPPQRYSHCASFELCSRASLSFHSRSGAAFPVKRRATLSRTFCTELTTPGQSFSPTTRVFAAFRTARFQWQTALHYREVGQRLLRSTDHERFWYRSDTIQRGHFHRLHAL